MIVDFIENKDLYSGLGEDIIKGLLYLANTNFDAVEKGKYEVEGDRIFAIVNEYKTKPASECEIEAHKKYIDIQFMVKGCELFGYTPLQNQKPLVAYNDTDDYTLYNEDLSYLKLTERMFIIFYPTDLHQPEVQCQASSLVKKVVVKIRVS